MKKKVDSVALMREAREKVSQQWSDKPREEQIRVLHEKYGHLVARKANRRAG